MGSEENMGRSRSNKVSQYSKRSKAWLAVILAISFLFAAILGFMIFLSSRASKKEPIYQYASMSEEAAARAYIWLNQMEDMALSYEEIKERMGEISLKIVLTPGEEKNTYVQSLDGDTYTECMKQAQNGLAASFRDAVRQRFSDAGYEGEISDEMLDEMMQEEYGVSVSEYLALCEVQLLPDLEELTETYSGEVTYE